MDRFLFRGQATIFRLQQTAARNTLTRLRQRIRFESTSTKEAPIPSSAQSKPSSFLDTKAWYAPVLAPIRALDRANRKRPLVVQTISSMVIYFLGDVSAQAISTSAFSEDRFESKRSVRAVIIGSMIAIPGYKWFIFLAKNFNYSSKAFSLGLKIVIHQFIFTPGISAYYFGMQALLTGATLQDAWIRVRDTIPTTWTNSFKVWPFVMAFNFTYVPVELRSIFAGVVAIGWQSYLSWINKQAEIKERAMGLTVEAHA